MRELSYGAGLLCLGMSLVLFLAMGADKRLAQTGGRRIPERRLFALAVLLGAPGGLLGMVFFRHKTRHRNFAFGFRALTLLQLGLLAALAYGSIRAPL